MGRHSLALQYKTFKQWNKLGYRVIKGSKSHIRLRGVFLFGEHQVWKPPPGVRQMYPSEYKWDDC